ncbi:LysR family transcriptional regulator [Novosphingobium sp. KCTC 2891]|uniref:LysR family transcriptional regulator n=1 Tax=Novosphingobium sp. KCTC 2891 TaxID=2989730 RepID=UPI002221A98E|nr:LysR family transcriptional regulator [Novosphingobium sp. KCTC 2891]MCW1382521.1 LysR family transcriptional regulator [Novosphingobium sp. KCTC 2891]
MLRDELGDLAVFLAVAEEQSFTRAAARLGTSQSALSQTVRRLEEHLGVKLLARTTRTVNPTEAGEQLLATLRPALGDIRDRLAALGQFRDRPAGLVRITTSRHAAESVLWPAIDRVMARYPDVEVELSIDGALTNIVADRFDAGVRLGESVEKDMIALRIGPDLRLAVVAAPGYFADRPVPRTPRDLTGHRCINLRMATRGNLYAWEFEKDGQALNVRVEGPLIVNDGVMALQAARAGHGIACTIEDEAMRRDVAEGRLVRVLEDWCPPFAGHHLYYPDRRNLSPAFRAVLEELRATRT